MGTPRSPSASWRSCSRSLLTIVGGLIVLPALCLIPLAASRGFRVRTAISMVLLVAASLLYVVVLVA